MKSEDKAKLSSLEDITDKYIGKIGTPKRDAFEMSLRMDVLVTIKGALLKRDLAQEQRRIKKEKDLLRTTLPNTLPKPKNKKR